MRVRITTLETQSRLQRTDFIQLATDGRQDAFENTVSPWALKKEF